MNQSTTSFALLCILALAMAGCASNVKTDYDSQAPFASYSTYAFEPGQARTVQSLDESRVRNALEETLAAEGFEKVPPEQAELWTRFRFEEKRKYESSGFSYGFGLFNRPFGFGLTTRPEARPVEQEQLVVELVDPQSNRVVWQGSSRQYLTENMAPQARRELINQLVENMFDSYPPEEGR